MGRRGVTAARRHSCLVIYLAHDTIGIGSDHNGFELKEQLRVHLTERGERVHDSGCFSRVLGAAAGEGASRSRSSSPQEVGDER